MNEDKRKEYEKNGLRSNVARLCAQMDMLYDDMKFVKGKISSIAGNKVRSKMNSWLIGIIIVAVISLTYKVMGG